MPTPEMNQIATLTSADFERYPVWLGVHNYDCGEPWPHHAALQLRRPADFERPPARQPGRCTTRPTNRVGAKKVLFRDFEYTPLLTRGCRILS
jgi:hypothetical protein